MCQHFFLNFNPIIGQISANWFMNDYIHLWVVGSAVIVGIIVVVI